MFYYFETRAKKVVFLSIYGSKLLCERRFLVQGNVSLPTSVFSTFSSVSGRQEKVPLCDVNSCLELREMSQEQESIVGDETSEPPDPKLVDFPAELKVFSVQKIFVFSF